MVLIMRTLFFVLFPVSEVMLSSKETNTKIGIAQLKSGYVPGDFIIGAVFSIHERPLLSGEGDALSCGSMHEQYGIHRVESAFFAVDQINKNGGIIPGIKLGVHIKDACWSESIALRQTIKLIGDPSRPEDYNSSTDNLKNLCSKEPISPLIGVVGPSSSGVTIQVQNLLKLFQIPEIGYAATSEDLANIKEYPYFLRVVPSDTFQTRLIWRLLKNFNWTYVSIVYTNDNYGQSAMTYFRKYAADWDICIANYRAVDVIATPSDFDKVITSLNEGRKANVIICYCDGPTVTGLFKSIQESNLTGRFTFIFSDSWASRHATVKGYDDEAAGSIFISIEETENPEFDRYFLSRNLTNNRRNPWFDEFWEHQFNCKINATDETESKRCTGNESLRVDYQRDSKIGYVIKSVYSMAYALQDMRRKVCNSTDYICTELRAFNTSEYMQHLLKVNFTYRDDEIRFNSNGEPEIIKYIISNYQKRRDNDYEFVQIGHFQRKNNMETLTLFRNVSIQFSGDDGVIVSRCSDPCPFGSAQISNNEGGDKKCCWTCLPCKIDEIIYNGSSCLQCYEGFWPNETKTHCVETILKFVLLTYSIVGIALTLITACIFLKYRSTPVVKSASKELCYVMLVGMIGAHSTTIIITTTEHTVTTCTVLRIVPQISFTFIYSALLVKTNRLARILTISKRKFPNMRPRLMSIGSQIIITLSIVGIQAVIIAVMFVRIPTTLNTDYHPEQGALYCSLPPEVTLPPFMFIIFLVLLCTVYAFETRNLPDNFSEAKFIGLAMYVTCITWIATSLIYYGSKLKIITMCIYSSTNAFVVLSFLFFPKLYILLCKPEQNTRANFVTTKGIRCIITGGRRYSTADTDDSNSKFFSSWSIKDFGK